MIVTRNTNHVRRPRGTEVYVFKDDYDRYHIIIDALYQNNLEYIIYEPEGSKIRSKKTKHDEKVYTVVSPNVRDCIRVQVWETTEFDTVTDIMTERMLDGYGDITADIRDKDGFMILIKKKDDKYMLTRKRPTIELYGIGPDDSEGNSLASISQLCVPGVNVIYRDNIKDRYPFVRYSIKPSIYNKDVMDFVTDITEKISESKFMKEYLYEVLANSYTVEMDHDVKPFWK